MVVLPSWEHSPLFLLSLSPGRGELLWWAEGYGVVVRRVLNLFLLLLLFLFFLLSLHLLLLPFFFLTLIALSPEVEVLDNKNQKDL